MPENTALNIVHVILSRGFAGSERSTSESCNQQCKTHQVTVIVRRDHRRRGASIVDHLDPRVKVIEVRARWFTQAALASALETLKPDIIHCHLRRSTRLVAKIRPAAACVSTLHIEVNGPHFMHMDGLICNARWQVDKMPNEFKGLVHKAANSLIPHRRLSDEERKSLREALQLLPGQIAIGAVGRYHPSKGWDTLIEAFKPIQAPQAVLLFFGSGSQEQTLKEQAEGDARIRFVGYRSDIKAIYQALDLLVCPSRYEPLPRVMLEAMDAGLPVIASDAGGCKELIDDYGGVCVPVDNSEALRAALEEALVRVPPRHYPDLSAHYIENANEAMVGFYRDVIARRTQSRA